MLNAGQYTLPQKILKLRKGTMADAHDTIQITFSGGLVHQEKNLCNILSLTFVYQEILRLLKTTKNNDKKIKEELCIDSTS